MRKLFALLCCSASLFSLPAQVLIVRHAEKDPVTRGLTAQGEERAAALAYYLTQTNYLLGFGPPAALFASRAVPISDRIVPRTIETLMPLSQLMGMPIHSPYNGYQVNEMANLILNNPKYNGKNIVICWNHSSIHDLVNAFGYQLPFDCTFNQHKYPDCRFDLVISLIYPIPPGTTFATVYFQQLLFGDISCEVPPLPYPPALPPTTCPCNDPVSCAQICDIVCPNVGQGDE
ncbi:MAG: hypothetical protein JSR58_02765 [Verrucomicrobia bacterium]|nr:hypothetical protein [Verrucomicrobiota bacterium]